MSKLFRKGVTKQTFAGRKAFHARRTAASKARVMAGARTSVARSADRELKFHDLDIDDVVVAAGGTIAQDSCNLIAQGLTESTRVGRKLNIKSILWRWSIIMAGATNAGLTTETLRVILYLDKQANGATAAVTDILESADYQSFNNLSNKNRFKTLMDRTYSLSAGGGTNSGAIQFGEVQEEDMLFMACDIPIEYSLTTGVIAGIRSNNIGVLLLSREGIALFGSKMRLRFAD